MVLYKAVAYKRPYHLACQYRPIRRFYGKGNTWIYVTRRTGHLGIDIFKEGRKLVRGTWAKFTAAYFISVINHRIIIPVHHHQITIRAGAAMVKVYGREGIAIAI